MKNDKTKYAVLGIVGIFIVTAIIIIIFNNFKSTNENHVNHDDNKKQADVSAPPLEKTINKYHFRTIGDKDAKNKIVVFADYRCPACYEFHKTINAHYNDIENGNINYTEIPYRVIDVDSDKLAAMDKAASEKLSDKEYFDVKNSLYEQGQKSEPSVRSAVEFLGDKHHELIGKYNAYQYDKINNSIGHKYGVDRTPTVFVNDKKINPSDINKYLK